LDTLRAVGVQYDGKGLDYFIPDNTQLGNRPLPLTHQKGYVALVIGASYFNKKLPLNKLQELCAAIPYPMVLIGDQQDASVGAVLEAMNPTGIYNACGKYSINESALLIKESKYVVSHDTGFLHIAAALNKPTITIWGATTPVLQFEAFYAEHSTAPRFNSIVPHLACQPCTKQGSASCPKKHFNCMMQQEVKAIAARIVI
jgi:ADP-heptose:LPS heptosyltransferase